ncbi:MAG: Gfo/Idh/MocA family oxidoreductase [Bacteroidota bacterium]
MKRRTFIQNSSAAASSLLISPDWSILRRSTLNDIQIGVIGCKGMGWSNTSVLLEQADVALVGICDVDQNVIDQRIQDHKEMRPDDPTPKTYRNHEDLLQDPSIDAVVIGTPDHWHCKIMVDALAAGKHVYVEKPVANTIEESYLMVAAQQKYNKVVQVGQWQRSGTQYRVAKEIVNSGQLGQIRLVKCWAYQGWMKPMQPAADTAVPDGVDYKRWLGPAPDRAFNPNRFHFNFRWFWDYAGGLMTDWGVHEIDIALYIMGAEAPKSVVASGGKLAYPNDPAETPDTMQAIFEYDDFTMLWEHATGIDGGPYGRREGIAFIGNNGTLIVNRQGYEIVSEREFNGWNQERPEKMKSIESRMPWQAQPPLQTHCQNFIAAVKANDHSMLNTPIESGAIAAINAQMGNIALRSGQKIYWDSTTRTFKDNALANKLAQANYHNGWELPQL